MKARLIKTMNEFDAQNNQKWGTVFTKRNLDNCIELSSH